MRGLGSVAKPLQPAHCVGVWVFEVQIVRWGTRGWCDGRSVPWLRMGRLLMGADPQRCILALNRPTPVRSRFSVAQSLRGRSAPGGKLVFGVTESWGGRGVCCQLVFHAWSVLKSEPPMDAEWRENGWREGRHWRPRSWESDTSLCRRWFGSKGSGQRSKVGCRTNGL